LLVWRSLWQKALILDVFCLHRLGEGSPDNPASLPGCFLLRLAFTQGECVSVNQIDLAWFGYG